MKHKSYPLRTVEYSSESCDFVTLEEKTNIKIDGAYRYKRCGFWQRICDFTAYRLLATPCAYFYTKHKFRERFIGKDKIKELKCGFFIYSNHTQPIADAFSPNVLTFPKKNSIIIHKENLSMPILGRHLKRLGGLPLPEDMRAAKNFTDEVQARISRGEAVTVYPEAHVWEYFTELRDFPDSTLDLPVRCAAPVITATRTYRQAKRGRVVCDIYIDGPFYPDTALSKKDARAKLKSEVYSAMLERTRLSTVKVVEYKKQ